MSLRQKRRAVAMGTGKAAAPEPAERPLPRPGFRAVYDTHFAFVWRTLQRFGVRESDLADAAQEVFMAVYRRLPDFEGRSKLSTWLFSICFNVASTRTRRAHVRREVLDQSYARASAPSPDPDHRLQLRRDLDLLQAILAEMDLGHRAVFCLYELEELTGEQIAELMQLPLGTVYSRLRKARVIIERRLRRAGRGPELGLRALKESP